MQKLKYSNRRHEQHLDKAGIQLRRLWLLLFHSQQSGRQEAVLKDAKCVTLTVNNVILIERTEIAKKKNIGCLIFS